MAERIIRLFTATAEVVNADPVVRDCLAVKLIQQRHGRPPSLSKQGDVPEL